ncbi:MAG: gliding motility-associated C-terminal domain-containing protein [Bacteroidota bacterium]
MRTTKALLFSAVFLLAAIRVEATHIVGAEMWYECLSAQTNRYRINLKLYRDCLNGQAEYDPTISIFIFQSNDPSQVRVVDFILQPPSNIPAPTWSQCTGTIYPLCVEEGLYSGTVTLPPIPGGYDVGWARCCRNFNIDNLFNPGDQGVTFVNHIPGPDEAVCNNMPTFNNTIPIFICVDEEFVFDHSATDVDGDSLVYSMSRPFDGLNFQGFGAGNAQPGSNDPVVSIANPMGPPPYRSVIYSSPSFSPAGPFGPQSASIDPQTGLLRVRAPNTGVYVVAISVFEYRDGVLLSENKRDVQIHVVPCLPQNDPPVISHIFQPGDIVVGDTIILSAIDTSCYTVEVRDTNNNPIIATPVSAIFSGPNPPSVTQTGTSPLTLDVCWNSTCDFANSTVELVIQAWDQSNCPIYNPAYDTVFIRIEPPVNVVPVVGHQLPLNNPAGPDTLVIEFDSTDCWTMWVADTANTGVPPSFSYVVEEIGNSTPTGITMNIAPDLSFQDSIPLEFCWTPGCDNVEKLYRVILRGVMDNACPPNNRDWDTVYISVPGIPNPPPVTTPDLTGNLFSNDTVFIDVHEDLCFLVTVQDTFPAVDLDLNATLEATDSQPTGGVLPTALVLNDQDSLLVEICWYPTCDNINRTFRYILEGVQENDCGQFAQSRDTVYIVVNEIINPPPVISHSFLPGYEVDGDTIIIAADSAACYEFTLRDSGDNTFLVIEAYTELLATLDRTFQQVDITLTDSTDTLLAGEVCFVPGCDFLDQTLQVILVGRDTFDCRPSNWVYDTTYVRVVEPFNNPPTIQTFLGGLPTSGGVVEVEPRGEPYCYRVEITDPDLDAAALTAEGVSEIFGDPWRYGNSATITASGTNPLILEVCWAPSCYDSGKEFELRICGRDTSRCGLTEEVCDAVTFRVRDCSIEVQNVFTPNNDGINDDFIPFQVSGVEYYRLQVFDRWGKEVYQGRSGTWDGTLGGGGGQAMPEGVYYYIFEYQFWSALGVPLKDTKVGWVTLLR